MTGGVAMSIAKIAVSIDNKQLKKIDFCKKTRFKSRNKHFRYLLTKRGAIRA